MSDKNRVNATVPISVLKEIEWFLEECYKGRFSGMPVTALGFYVANCPDGVHEIFKRSGEMRSKALSLSNDVDEWKAKALGTWNKVPE